MKIYYFENDKNRESAVTREIIQLHAHWFLPALELNLQTDRIIVEFSKWRYGTQGDVDIAIWKNPGLETEELIGIEVKVSHFTRSGWFKSLKPEKHHKQLKALEKDGWDKVYLFEVILLEPENSWMHSQVFDALDGYISSDKSVEDGYGHATAIVSPVEGKPESMAGGYTTKMIKDAKRLEPRSNRKLVLKGLAGVDWTMGSVQFDQTVIK